MTAQNAMEVHHHPEVEKKNFKQYLLEGLMIFVAVTLGFFAESLRENINGKDKEEEYITSITRDLEHDKTDLVYTIKDNQNKLKSLDSLLALAGSDLKDVKNRKRMYETSWGVSSLGVFISHDATMSQLKASGALQFIKREHIADSIAKYDLEMRGIYAAEAPYTRYINFATEAMTEIMNFNLKDDVHHGDYQLVTNDPQKIQVFFNKVKLERGWTANYIQNLQDRIPYNRTLIQLLKKEYDLK